jgi:hypothetical protein
MTVLRIELDDEVDRRLTELEAELPRLGYRAGRKEIVEALVWDASAPQVLGPLMAFNMARARRDT